MKRSICIHIGLPKTATTTLQRGLFSNHSQLEFLGKRAGRDADPSLRRCVSDAAFRLANELFWEHVHASDIDESRRIWTEEVLPAVGPNKLPVYSFEGLAVSELDVRTAIARNLRDTFQCCRVMIGIRQPMDLVESLYFQRLKRNHLGKQAKRFEFPRSPSTEQWLESVVAGDELAPHLDYARTVRIFVDAVGRENVGVFALEDLKENAQGFADVLCGFLGIDREEGARLMEARRHNVRLSQDVALRMLRFERSGIASSIYASGGRTIRKRMLRLDRSDGSGSARLSISPESRNILEDRTREGNRWIAREFDLRLPELGYPT